MRVFLTFLAALAVAGAVPAGAQQSTTAAQMFAASRAIAVRISAEKGDYSGGINVRVLGWNKSQISLKRTLHNVSAADVTTTIKHSGSTFEVGTSFHGKAPRAGGILGFLGASDTGGMGVSYDMYVPANASVTLALTNGNVDIEGVTGALGGSTSNGNVTVAGAGGSIHLKTNNGNMDVGIASLRQTPSIDLDTNNGNVDLRVPAGFNAPVQTSVNNGNVTNPFATAKGAGSVTLATNNGDITVKR
jgi:hypothetical protein